MTLISVILVLMFIFSILPAAVHEHTRPLHAGYSEHQTGLAVDMTSARMQMGLYASFDQTPEGRWMLQYAHRYGFILGYPKGKEAITGYNYEPWHLRYVGVKEATTMKQKNWTFEEWWATR